MMPFRNMSRCTPLLFCLLAFLAAGCGTDGPGADNRSNTSSDKPGDQHNEDPPVARAVSDGDDGPPPLSDRELRRRLKAKNPEFNDKLQIGRKEGRIVAIGLVQTKVSDLTPLAGLKLEELHLLDLPVSDLGPLAGMPLKTLDIIDCPVTDISVLAGMPLEILYLEGSNIESVAPLKGLPLHELWINKTRVTDLRPLQGMEIRMLNLTDSPVTDISVVQKFPLNTLWLGGTPVEDFSALEGLYLESLDVHDTAFGNADLALLKGMPLQRLNIARTKVTDLKPLAGLQLQRLIFTPSRIEHGLEVIRNMSSLRELDTHFRPERRLTPEEFWERYDADQSLSPPPKTP